MPWEHTQSWFAFPTGNISPTRSTGTGGRVSDCSITWCTPIYSLSISRMVASSHVRLCDAHCPSTLFVSFVAFVFRRQRCLAMSIEGRILRRGRSCAQDSFKGAADVSCFCIA